MSKKTKQTDIQVSRHGNIFLCNPLTPKAKKWVKDYVQTEPWQWFGGRFSVDQHNIDELIQEMSNDGLSVT